MKIIVTLIVVFSFVFAGVSNAQPPVEEYEINLSRECLMLLLIGVTTLENLRDTGEPNSPVSKVVRKINGELARESPKTISINLKEKEILVKAGVAIIVKIANHESNNEFQKQENVLIDAVNELNKEFAKAAKITKYWKIISPYLVHGIDTETGEVSAELNNPTPDGLMLMLGIQFSKEGKEVN